VSQDPFGQLEAAPAAAPEPAGDTGDWPGLWQMPTLLLSLLLIGLGIRSTLDRSPGPTVGALIDRAERLVEAGAMAEAADHIDRVVRPRLHEADTMEQALFHAVVADWVALAASEPSADRLAASRQIAHQYDQAQTKGLPLDVVRRQRLVTALLDLGRVAEAEGAIERLEARLGVGGSDDDRRRLRALHRRRAEVVVADDARSIDARLEAVHDVLALDGVAADDVAWAHATAADLLLDDDRPQDAVDRLLPAILRLEPAIDPDRLSGLLVRLGTAYARLERPTAARSNLERGLARMTGGGPDRGRAMLELAMLDEREGDLESALDRYEIVERDYVGTPLEIAGALGRADVLGAGGDHEAAIEQYGRVLELIANDPAGAEGVRSTLLTRVLQRHDVAIAMGDVEVAQRYVDLAAGIAPDTELEADTLLRLAMTSEQRGLRLAAGSADPIMDPDVRAAHRRAAEAARAHAELYAATPGQEETWFQSLEIAARNFDAAGRWEEAIEAQTTRMDGLEPSDPRRAGALAHLAELHLALGSASEADGALRRLIDEHPRSPQASAATVPLARSAAAAGRWAEAESLLRRVVGGERGLSPDARDYEEAIVELARIEHERDRLTEAIDHLDFILERYPGRSDIEELRYRLADALRRSAAAAAARVDEDPALSPSERRDLLAERTRRLDRALGLLEEVVAGLGGRSGSLTPLETTMLQQATLARADVAFDLERYEAAAGFYDEAARRYGDDQSSMFALVQIISCYQALGDAERASAAERRARIRLRQLPEDAFLEEGSLMDRGAWERWLDRLGGTASGADLAAGVEGG